MPRLFLLLLIFLLLFLLLPPLSFPLPLPSSDDEEEAEVKQWEVKAEIERLLHSAAAYRYGLPPNHTYDYSNFYRPSFSTSSPPSFFASSSWSSSFSPSVSPPPPYHPQSITTAIQLYQAAARLNSSLALLSLAEISLFAEGSSSVDILTALPLLQSAASLGSSRAQHYLSLLYYTGIGLAKSSAHSLLHLYFAALGNDPLALMALGWRHSVGDGVPRSCEAAVGYYHRVARRVKEELEVDSLSFILEKVRLQGEDGGEGGRSVVSDQVEEDLILYYRAAAERGDTSAQLALANVLLMTFHSQSQIVEKSAFDIPESPFPICRHKTPTPAASFSNSLIE